MKASKKDIKYFKGVLVQEVQTALRSNKTYLSDDQVSDFIKKYTGEYDEDLFGISCSDMSKDQMQMLKEASNYLVVQLTMPIKEDNNDLKNLNF